MGTKSRNKIMVGFVIVGLVGSNAYAYIDRYQSKYEIQVEQNVIDNKNDQLDVLVSQLMNKSSQYASHEDIIRAFNLYSELHRIEYQGTDYYADIRQITAHTYDENKKTRYVVQADMTFLKDKLVNGISYVQNQLPINVMEKGKNIAKEERIRNHDNDLDKLIPDGSLLDIEKEAKDELVVHQWKQDLSFNMDENDVMSLTSTAEKSILKEFLRSVVLKKLGVSEDETVEIDVQKTDGAVQKITVNVDNVTHIYLYNQETNVLKEIT